MPVINVDDKYRPKTEEEKKFAANMGETAFIALAKLGRDRDKSMSGLMMCLEGKLVKVTVTRLE